MPFERHWRWCQHERRAHPQGPLAAVRVAIIGVTLPVRSSVVSTLMSSSVCHYATKFTEQSSQFESIRA